MYGSRTPMYGSQTPLYDGSRTPHYGGQTPQHEGSGTPGRGSAWDPANANTPNRYATKRLLEPRHEKTCLPVSEQVQH